MLFRSPGERLPSERELATKFEVSRPTLRDALSDMEKRGLIVTRPGAGVFVAQVLGSAFSPPLVALFSTHEEALFDYLSFRRDLEGLVAARAAEHANETDLAVISSIFKRMEVAHEKRDRKSTRLNSSHVVISYAVFCLKKKK